MNLKKTSLWRVLGCAAAASLFTATAPAADPVLIWADEFDTDGLPDSSKWLYDVGGDGWGNAEEQFYTEGRAENARVENGILIIEAHKQPWPSSRNARNDYTSARLVSKGRGDWLYGRIEVRAKIPAGRGTWPAIWMLPTGNAYGTWPRSGEIDIMEHVGFDMGTVHGSLHTLDRNWTSQDQTTGSTSVPEVATAFHNYAVDWSPGSIRFLIDGNEYYTFNDPGTGWGSWPFDQPFHLILNLAVGGTWGGQAGIDPDIWPARLEIDYVRVYDLGETVALDTDGDLDPNATDPDDDGDGLTDLEEHALGTNLLNVDTDGDGFSDFDEVEAGTSPVLKGAYPGSDSSILMINNDFAFGADPWIVHTNLRSARTPESWVGQVASWAGSYSVFDYVTTSPTSEDIVFSNYAAGTHPYAEHLVYQEANRVAWGLQPGDVIRFRGTASASASVEGMVTQAFLRTNDLARLPVETVLLDIGTEPAPFELEMTLSDFEFLDLQSGFLIEGPQSEVATITFSGLEVTINEAPTWAGYPIEDAFANTGDWLGWIYVGGGPWVWSATLDTWFYLPEAAVKESGAWAYFLKGN